MIMMMTGSKIKMVKRMPLSTQSKIKILLSTRRLTKTRANLVLEVELKSKKILGTQEKEEVLQMLTKIQVFLGEQRKTRTKMMIQDIQERPKIREANRLTRKSISTEDL